MRGYRLKKPANVLQSPNPAEATQAKSCTEFVWTMEYFLLLVGLEPSCHRALKNHHRSRKLSSASSCSNIKVAFKVAGFFMDYRRECLVADRLSSCHGDHSRSGKRTSTPPSTLDPPVRSKPIHPNTVQVTPSARLTLA